MSRAQESAVIDTAKSQGAQQFGDSQNEYKAAVEDIGSYKDQLSQYGAKNPYTQGGEYQTAENRVLANTADASANAGGAAVQSQARRTGQNTMAANATAEEMQRQNERELGGQQAAATDRRIASEAEYNKGVLGATAVPVGMETQLAEGQGRMSQGDLGIQAEASKTPGFWDTMGDSFAKSLGQFAGSPNITHG